MFKVGEETDGYCPRCRLNTYQIIAATDGRLVLAATCRTCRNTFPWKAEVSPEDLRQKQIQKLHKLQRAKTGGPEVLSRTRRKVGDLDQLKQAAVALGRPIPELPDDKPADEGTPPVKPAPTATSGHAPTERWRALTANLGWRDGKPYQSSRVYKEGDVLLHKALGLGVVQAVVHDQACVVLFRDAETVLEMGQASER